MTKKQAKNERTPREKTPLDADSIEARATDVFDLAKKLSDIAQKMRDRKIDFIEPLGGATFSQALDKLRGSINSIDRAYTKRSVTPIRAKVAEKRDSHGEEGGSGGT